MDSLLVKLNALLTCAEANLTLPVCRAFLNPGVIPAFDVCTGDENGNGQLWVGVFQQTPNWPAGTGLPSACPTQWTAVIQIGVVRCVQGVIQDDGQPPDADLITNDATQQLLDRWELLEAIQCCWQIEARDMVFDFWQSIDPQGGCVGGYWQLRVKIGGCQCQPPV